MAYITGVARDQTMLLPESLEDYIGREHPVRFLDAFVDGLNLARCGFGRTQPKETGRPPFSPGDLLKLYLWGYLNRVRSSRRLERECVRNLELIWLMRKLAPDFKTIADFRKDNAKAFKAVFRQFHLLCGELGLFGRELVAIDGTKLKAVNSPARNYDGPRLRRALERIDAKIEEFVAALDQADRQEPGPQAEAGSGSAEDLRQKIDALKEPQGQYQQLLEEMDKSGATQVSLTDPDSRRMHKVGVGYNGQIAVDDKHKLIVAQEVVNEPTDYMQLAPMAKAAQQALEVQGLKVLADGGCHHQQSIAAAEQAGVEVYVPRARKGSAVSEGRFDKSQFCYDAGTDTYRCPGAETLSRESECLKRGQKHYLYSNAKACRQCPLKSQCTPTRYRRITRWHGEAVLDRVDQRVAAHPELIQRRKALVEHPFGSIKFWSNQDAFLMRGLEKVRAEFSLSTLCYNMHRVFKLVDMDTLLEAWRKRAAALFCAMLVSIGHRPRLWEHYAFPTLAGT